MNYENFKKEKSKILIERKDIIDLSENNLYSFMKNKFNLQEINGENIKGHIKGKVHRCHLVEDWLSIFKLPEEYKKTIGVSEGVRHSLEILMQNYSEKNWYIPKDVYPVYQKLANKYLKNKIQEYPTLFYDNIFEVNKIPENINVVLSICPLKPYGRKNLKSEFLSLKQWLRNSADNRLILDCVYMNDLKSFPEIIDLYNTGQVYLLFSLSKNWLLPQVLGLCWIAKEDNNLIKDKFKSLIISYKKLEIAYDALNNHQDRPFILKDNLIKQINIVSSLKLNAGLIIDRNNPSYLFYSTKDFNYWLEKGFLTIPATVFGGDSGTIISTLY